MTIDGSRLCRECNAAANIRLKHFLSSHFDSLLDLNFTILEEKLFREAILSFSVFESADISWSFPRTIPTLRGLF